MSLYKVLPILAAIILVNPVDAATLRFNSTLDGTQEVPPVTTNASGIGQLVVDTITENLFVSLSVFGISTDDLRDDLVAAPVGPVHLHLGERGVNGPIAVPFAFNGTYRDTSDGFQLETIVSYDSAVSGRSFSEFLTSLNTESVYFNVHTDTFRAGEIRGQVAPEVAPIPLPASGVLMASVLAFGAWRMRRASAA